MSLSVRLSKRQSNLHSDLLPFRLTMLNITAYLGQKSFSTRDVQLIVEWICKITFKFKTLDPKLRPLFWIFPPSSKKISMYDLRRYLWRRPPAVQSRTLSPRCRDTEARRPKYRGCSNPSLRESIPPRPGADPWQEKAIRSINVRDTLWQKFVIHEMFSYTRIYIYHLLFTFILLMF